MRVNLNTKDLFWRVFSACRVWGMTIVCISALSSCASTALSEQAKASNPRFVTDFPKVDTSNFVDLVDHDVFKRGDIAEITIYNVENLSGTYTVDRSGSLQLPLIGTVKTAGLSTLELQETLTQRYGQDYLQNPSISVKIEQQRLGSIVVDGSVENPGVFEIFNVIHMTEAIALAQGLETDASPKSVYLSRTIDGERRIREVNLRAIRLEGAEDPEVIPNDIIFVPESRGRVAFREFLRTLPLLNTALIITQTR